jgi:hypothetical protein
MLALIVRYYLESVLSLNTSLWWRTFAFGYVSIETNWPKLRERSGGSLERKCNTPDVMSLLSTLVKD